VSAKDGKRRGKDGRLRAVTRLAERLGGARLCYGEPIREGGRTIVPVARVRAAGGGGWGSGVEEGRTGGGGGGGGSLDARPVGFIEIAPEGVRFEPIETVGPLERALKVAGAAALALATTAAGLRAARGALRAGRTGRRLLGRGG